MPLPHDFRAAARQPIAVNGGGAPLQVSGGKLQDNFEYLDKELNGLPPGEAGDMLYHDGSNWVALNNPGSPASGHAYVLQHDGGEPAFVEYEQITVDICQNGTPVQYTILGIPSE